MSIYTVNGLPILHARICMPRRGVWHGLVSVQAEAVDGLEAAVELGLGDVTLTGMARRSGAHVGRVELLVVGGAGGLSTELQGRYYVDAQARLPVGDILDETGETLSTTVDATALEPVLARWTRRRGPAGVSLGELAKALGVGWRVLGDGTVWLGAETWPELELEHDVIAEWPAHDSAELAVDALTLTPGVVHRERRVSYVQHLVQAAQLRTTVWYEVE